MAAIYGTSSGGGKYTIGSQKGQDFVNSAKPGSSLTGADGSTWTKNNDGSTTIVQNGKTYTVGGKASSGGSSGSGGPSGGYQKYTGGNAQMDAEIGKYKDKWDQAYAAGDVQGMIDANNAANQIRNQYGYAAEKVDVTGLPGYDQYAGRGGGGGYSGGSGGGVDDLSSYLEQMYQAQKEAAIAGIKNAYEQNVAAIDKAMGEIAPKYQAARNQTAGSAEQSARNFSEYAAASGLGSGTSAQAELSRNMTLQNNLNQLNTEEANAYADLELQKSQAEIEYNNAIAQAEASGNAQLAAALYQEKVRVQNTMIEQQNALFQQALAREQFDFQKQQAGISNSQWQQEFDYAKQQQAQSELAKWGEAMLENGVMPTNEMLTAMGMSTDQANAYIAFIQSQLAAKQAAGGTRTYSTGGGSSSRSGSGSSVNSGQTVSAPGGQPENKGYAVDMNSVLALGYGPIDSDTLAQLEASGAISSYVDGNLIKFVKNDIGKIGGISSRFGL